MDKASDLVGNYGRSLPCVFPLMVYILRVLFFPCHRGKSLDSFVSAAEGYEGKAFCSFESENKAQGSQHGGSNA